MLAERMEPTPRQLKERDSQQVPRKYTYKAALTGKFGVGKTSLFMRLQGKEIPTENSRTSGLDKYHHIAQSNEGPIKLTVWDTAGMERNRSLTDGYYRNSHAIILVFDITDQDSMNSCRDLVREIKAKHLCPHAKYFLIANKTDLSDYIKMDASTIDGFINNCEEIKFSAVKYTSALNDETSKIEELFSEIAKMLVGMQRGPSIKSYDAEFQSRTQRKSTCC